MVAGCNNSLLETKVEIEGVNPEMGNVMYRESCILTTDSLTKFDSWSEIQIVAEYYVYLKSYKSKYYIYCDNFYVWPND